MSEHPIEGLMNTAMSSIQNMIDVNTIIGEPIETNNNVIIIPLKKNENPELNQEIHFSFILDDYFIFDRFTHLNYFFNL